MSKTKKMLFVRMFCIFIICLALGILTLCLPAELIARTILIIIGAFFVIDGALKIIKFYNKSNLIVITSALSIVLGILLMFNLNIVLNIILAVWFIVFPIVQLYFNKNNFKEELKYQLPKIILGFIVIIFGFESTFGLFLTIVGWTIIGLSCIYLILGLISLAKHD